MSKPSYTPSYASPAPVLSAQEQIGRREPHVPRLSLGAGYPPQPTSSHQPSPFQASRPHYIDCALSPGMDTSTSSAYPDRYFSPPLRPHSTSFPEEAAAHKHQPPPPHHHHHHHHQRSHSQHVLPQSYSMTVPQPPQLTPPPPQDSYNHSGEGLSTQQSHQPLRHYRTPSRSDTSGVNGSAFDQEAPYLLSGASIDQSYPRRGSTGDAMALNRASGALGYELPPFSTGFQFHSPRSPSSTSPPPLPPPTPSQLVQQPPYYRSPRTPPHSPPPRATPQHPQSQGGVVGGVVGRQHRSSSFASTTSTSSSLGMPSSSPLHSGRPMHKATSFTACSSAGRRLAHILSEQKRREKINGGFDELKSVIPECAQNTDSKATILRKAVDYILLLEDEIRKYADAYPDFHRTGPGVGNAGTAGTSTGADVITIEDDSILARS